MKLLWLLGLSLVLAFPTQDVSDKVVDKAVNISKDSSDKVAKDAQKVSDSATGRKLDQKVAKDTMISDNKEEVDEPTQKTKTQPQLEKKTQKVSEKALSNSSTQNATQTSEDVVPKNLTQEPKKRSLASHLRNLTRTSPKKNATVHEEAKPTQGRKLLQTESRVPTEGRGPTEKKTSSLKSYPSEISDELKSSAIYNHTEMFWQDVRKWTQDANPECKNLMMKWFDPLSSIQFNGLPTPFSMIGNSSAVCESLKKVIRFESLVWQTEFLNDLASTAMGSLWMSGKVVKDIQLPDELEFLFYIQFDPATKKILVLEIVPVEPDVIFEALASRPIKSFHNLLRTFKEQGFSSPKYLTLLSDKFVLEVPNMFLEKADFKTKFSKSEMQEFMDQLVRIFNFEDAKLEVFSIEFYDDKNVVAEMRFEELPLKANGIVLEDFKFLITHSFDCKEETGKQDTEVVGRRTAEVMAQDTSKDTKDKVAKDKVTKDKDTIGNYCLLDRVQILVNHPISLMTLFPVEMDETKMASKPIKDEKISKPSVSKSVGSI